MQGRFPGLDAIRACACFLVILLHVAAIQFSAFFSGWHAAAAWDGLARMSVPLFFMLSGFLLMENRPDSLMRFYYRRYLRILLPFAFTCFLYYFTPMYAGYTPTGFIAYIAVHYVDYHLWYIYALLGLYLGLPFFIKIVNGSDGVKLAWLYVGIWACAFMLSPSVMGGNPLAPEVLAFQADNPNLAEAYIISDLFSSFFMSWNLLFFYGFMGYFIVAWLIRQYFGRISRPMRIAGLVICMAATCAIIFLTWRASSLSGAPDQKWFMNLSPFVALQAIGFFIFAAGLIRDNPVIRSLSDKSYWIYLLHLILLRFFIGLAPLPQSRWTALAIPACAIIVFMTAYFAAIPLRAIELRLLKLLRVP